jgi:hypothetical protein
MIHTRVGRWVVVGWAVMKVGLLILSGNFNTTSDEPRPGLAPRRDTTAPERDQFSTYHGATRQGWGLHAPGRHPTIPACPCSRRGAHWMRGRSDLRGSAVLPSSFGFGLFPLVGIGCLLCWATEVKTRRVVCLRRKSRENRNSRVRFVVFPGHQPALARCKWLGDGLSPEFCTAKSLDRCDCGISCTDRSVLAVS